ncbi:MAG: hypothetical protein ACXW1Q_07215 [Halobacteriota archaeon]
MKEHDLAIDMTNLAKRFGISLNGWLKRITVAYLTRRGTYVEFGSMGFSSTGRILKDSKS